MRILLVVFWVCVGVYVVIRLMLCRMWISLFRFGGSGVCVGYCWLVCVIVWCVLNLMIVILLVLILMIVVIVVIR